MKFSTGNDVDFVKMSQTPIRMERENNYKEFKSAYDIDVAPKFGAGSEYGREQKEEARRKKYGIVSQLTTYDIKVCIESYQRLLQLQYTKF